MRERQDLPIHTSVAGLPFWLWGRSDRDNYQSEEQLGGMCEAPAEKIGGNSRPGLDATQQMYLNLSISIMNSPV